MSNNSFIFALEETRQVRGRLERDYKQLGKGRGREYARCMLQYLNAHQRAIEAALEHYPPSTAAAMLDIWRQKISDVQHLPASFQQLCEKLDGQDAGQIRRIAHDLHEMLAGLYQTLVDGAPSPRVREILENILQMEQSKRLPAFQQEYLPPSRRVQPS
ncbi:MAG: hypothetical protein R3292_11195 [Alcanivorax sp.]|nr:hypothetical protein [Alcanivorax sp.]